MTKKEDKVKIIRGVLKSMTYYGHKFTYAGEINGKTYLIIKDESGKETLMSRERARELMDELKHKTGGEIEPWKR